MKQILVILSLVALAACNTAKKKEQAAEAPKAPAPAVATVAPAQPAVKPKVESKMASEQQYTCTVNGDKRIVEYKTNNGRCEIHYTKQGTSEEVAWGQATPSICSDVFARIRSNIEGKGFSCESVSKGLAAK